MPDFRRGADAVAEAQKRAKSGGTFSPFAPEIFWKGDGDERYLLFLNPMVEIPTVEMISFIPRKRKTASGEKKTFYERVIARTDPAIGEDKDPMVEDWDGKPRDTCVAVAVELEPTLEKGAKGRMRPTGFHVKTDSYERRVRDEDGELTDETEEVTTPVVGFVHASPHNFFNVVSSADANDFPIEETAVKITRVGSDTSTTYSIQGYPDQELDLGDLVEFIDGVSYLNEEEMEALLDEVQGLDDAEAALLIGTTLLDKRLDELCDPERYEKLYEGIDESLDKFSGKGKKGGKKSERKERPARSSARRSRRTAEEEAPATGDAEPDAAPEAEVAPEPEEKPKRQRRTRKPAEPKAEAETTEESGPKTPDPERVSKLDKLRTRNEAHKAKATA